MLTSWMTNMPACLGMGQYSRVPSTGEVVAGVKGHDHHQGIGERQSNAKATLSFGLILPSAP